MEVLVFIIVLGFMVFVHELGHFLTAKRAGIKVEEFGFGFPPRLIGVRRGETVYSINAIPLGGFVRMLGENGDSPAPDAFGSARKLWRSAVLLAGPMMNILVSALIFGSAYLVGWPTPTESQVQVYRVMPGSPAQQAGLREGDVILQVDRQAIKKSTDLRDVTMQHLGQPLAIMVNRDGQDMTISVTPRTNWPPDEGPMGLGLWDRTTRVEPISYPLPQSLWMGAQRTAEAVGLTFYVPILLMKGMIPAELARPVGPVGIYQITSQAAQETISTGWAFPLLSIAGMLSAGLGVANLLPIPGLDGGRLLFILIEAVRGRRVSPEREGMIHFLGIVFLLSMVAIISYYDVFSPVNVSWDGLR